MKVTTWLIVIHDEQSGTDSRLIKVFGNMYDVEKFILKEIQIAARRYSQWKLDKKQSTTELDDFKEVDSRIIRGYAYFDNTTSDLQPFKISYSAFDEDDIEYVEING